MHCIVLFKSLQQSTLRNEHALPTYKSKILVKPRFLISLIKSHFNFSRMEEWTKNLTAMFKVTRERKMLTPK